LKIPLSRPDISQKEIKTIIEVLKTPYLSLGSRITEFEEKFSEFIGAKYAVAVSNATCGLHLIVRALEIDDGDEVITTPFSFISSANCILFERAKPVFADIDPDTLTIDSKEIERKVTKRTKAILAVDVFGHPADWDAISRIAHRYGLYLIEDSAEALGSEYKGRKCGTFGDAAVFSFYPNKQITTGEGGMVVTCHKEIAELSRSMANQGRRVKNGSWANHERLGYNYRISEINTALGIAQISRIREILSKRQKVANIYHKKLKGIDGIRIPFVGVDVKMGWFVYVILLSGQYSKKERDKLIKEMAKRGIECRDYFSSIHLQPFYKKLFGYQDNDFPVCERVSARTMALPFYNNLSREDIDYIVNNLQEVLGSV